jgi:hypothetical protein
MATSQVRTPEAPPPRPPGMANGRQKRAASPPPSSAAPPPAEDDEEDLPYEQLTAESDAPVVEGAQAQTFRPGSEEGFWEWLSGFSADDWQWMIGYLYRTSPKIDRRSNGRPINLTKYSNYFDADQVKREHGSGGYRMDLTRRNPVSGKYTRIAQYYFDVLDMDYPPKVPAGDWIDQPENDMWKWARPKIEQASALGGFPAPSAPPVDQNAIFNTILSGVKSLSDGNRGSDGTAAAAITALGSITAKLLERDSHAPAEDRGTTLVISFLQDELRAQREEIRAMRAAPAAAPKTLLEQIREIVPAVSEIKDVLGLKGTAARVSDTNWGDVLTEVIDKLSDHVPLFYEMWRGSQGQNGQPGAAPSARWQLPASEKRANVVDAQPAAAQPAAQPAAAQPAAPAGEQAKEEVPTMAADKRARYAAILKQWGGAIESVGPFMLDHFTAGLSGYTFRDWFISRKGIDVFSAFCRDVAPEDLTELAGLHAVLKIMMRPPEKVLQFFSEFLTAPGDEPPGAVIEDEDE